MGEWTYRPTFSWPRHYLEVSGQIHAAAAIPPGERVPSTHWIGGWVGPRAGLDYMEKWKFLPPPGLELWLLYRPARSQSLYRPWYTGSLRGHGGENKYLCPSQESDLSLWAHSHFTDLFIITYAMDALSGCLSAWNKDPDGCGCRICHAVKPAHIGHNNALWLQRLRAALRPET
jgi:hypothetical protein